MSVVLTTERLSVDDVLDRVRSATAGANVLFAGSTRDSFAGKRVVQLEYHAYEAMAEKTLRGIMGEAEARFDVVRLAVVHRLGVVPVGEDSVLIAVSAAHRSAAWEAGEWLLEEVKARTEIWKKETYDGDVGAWKANA